MLHRHRVLDEIVGLGRFFTDDKATADGVELLGKNLGTAVIEDREQHAVGVEGKHLVGFEDDVAVGRELNRTLAVEIELARADDPVVQWPLSVRVDGLRLLALESPNDRSIGVVTAAGGGERAKEIAADSRRALEKTMLLQLDQQEVGGSHRSDRVR